MTRQTAWRKALEQRNAEHETAYYLLVNQAEAFEIAAGVVPNSVKAMARCLVDWADEDQRKADAGPHFKKRVRA